MGKSDTLLTGASCNSANIKAGTTPANYTHANAIAACEKLNHASRSDWRLPSIQELQSLVDYSKSSPSIDHSFFPNTASSGYWSSSSNAAF